MEVTSDLFPSLSEEMELLASYLNQLGFILVDGMGVFKLSWQEVQAWSLLTQTELTPWEVNVLISASEAYVISIIDYREKSIDAPFLCDAILAAGKKEEMEPKKLIAEMDRIFGIKNDG